MKHTALSIPVTSAMPANAYMPNLPRRISHIVIVVLDAERHAERRAPLRIRRGRWHF